MLLSMIFNLLSSIYYFALHVTTAGSFPPPLSAKKEEELLSKSMAGDIEARNTLVEHNLRLVAHIVKKYYTTNCEQEDLISIGTIGLIKAINTFCSDKNIRLATYASRCIENEILMHFRSLKKTAQDVYINEPIDTDKDGNALTLIDIISDETDIEEEVDKKIHLEKLSVLLSGTLSDREKEILEMRYGLNGKTELTQREIAKILGISRSYVSRIETAALAKLKRHFS
ncbi:MAG: RNA polymerase sporulation sigma factor SigK [Oscillospiraceae bacterium]|nr:RNA polymerase sporulation sigma factor SigK [Oscillospiraceae bacterium]